MKDTKPTKQSHRMMDYDKMITYIEKKYKINTRDYLGLFGSPTKKSHFEIYQDITGDRFPVGGYPDYSGKSLGFSTEFTITRNGKKIPASKEEYEADFKLIHNHYKRYQAWCKSNPEPEYLDFWHWLIDNPFSSVSNGSKQYLPVDEIIGDETIPRWVRDITHLIKTEFQKELDKNGGLEVLVSW